MFRSSLPLLAVLAVVVAVSAVAGVATRADRSEATLDLHAVTAPAAATAPPSTDPDGAGGGRAGRIINGKPLDTSSFAKRWPFLVLFTSSQGACSGTLVTKRLVVTAAHCITGAVTDKAYVDSVRITAGTVYRSGAGTTPIKASRIVVHPSWVGDSGSGRTFDVALVQLASDAPASATPISVVGPGEDNIWGAGRGVATDVERGPRIAGFGRISPGPRSGPGVVPTVAQEADFPIYSDRDCQRNFRDVAAWDADKIVCGGVVDRHATGTTTAGVGTCFGDSGGPLVASANGQWRLIGPSSTTDENCLLREFGSGNTKLATIRDWLAANGVPIGAGSVTTVYPTPPPREDPEGAVIGGGPNRTGALLQTPADGAVVASIDGRTRFSYTTPRGITTNRFRVLSGTTVAFEGPAGAGYDMPNQVLPAGALTWCVSTVDGFDGQPGDEQCRTVQRRAAHLGSVTRARLRGGRWTIDGVLASTVTTPVTVTVRITRGGRTIAKAARKVSARGRAAATPFRLVARATRGASKGRFVAVVTVTGGGATKSRTLALR